MQYFSHILLKDSGMHTVDFKIHSKFFFCFNLFSGSTVAEKKGIKTMLKTLRGQRI